RITQAEAEARIVRLDRLDRSVKHRPEFVEFEPTLTVAPRVQGPADEQVDAPPRPGIVQQMIVCAIAVRDADLAIAQGGGLLRPGLRDRTLEVKRRHEPRREVSMRRILVGPG